MKLTLLALAVLVVLALSKAAPQDATSTTPKPKTAEERLKDMETLIEGLSRQVMLQQFYVEEKVRSDGNSGLKQTRVARDGNKNYHTPAHIDSRFMAIHDHANYDRTVGMGELMVVMNGVEFRTRHNDYKLRMPSPTKSDYNAMEYIPYPPVPKSVTDKKTVDEQIIEMREYFKAFKTQNVTHRDYRAHFKPVLCYLEGAWTTATKNMDEPFQSDRHSIDAANWFDLMDKTRFTSYTGTKSVLENFAYLPTTIMSVDEGVPHYAQWNYRILCHPINGDLPLSSFEIQDDLLFRFPQRMAMNKVGNTRGARYALNRKGTDHYSNGKSLLDDLMMQIPGKNNYGANLRDNSFDMVMEDIHFDNHTLINSGYYHRYFKTLDRGAMGTKNIHRGYSDANLFVAQTTHPQVAPMTVKNCHRRVCQSWTVRYSYALPLEVIYMSPLFQWNPYNIAEDQPDAVVRESGKRTGQNTLDKAYNGTNFKVRYLTPVEFYSSGNVQRDPADTARNGAAVLDKQGQIRMVSSSGQRIVTPAIEGVGQVRLRYPIMPIHGEGSGVWKELNALKDMSMHINRYASLYEERPGMMTNDANGTDSSVLIHYQMSTTIQDPPGEHNHDFFITQEELEELKKGHRITVTTSEDMGHSHDLELQWRFNHVSIRTCDGLAHCWDSHTNSLIKTDA